MAGEVAVGGAAGVIVGARLGVSRTAASVAGCAVLKLQARMAPNAIAPASRDRAGLRIIISSPKVTLQNIKTCLIIAIRIRIINSLFVG